MQTGSLEGWQAGILHLKLLRAVEVEVTLKSQGSEQGPSVHSRTYPVRGRAEWGTQQSGCPGCKQGSESASSVNETATNR